MKFADRLSVNAAALSSTTLNVGTVITMGAAAGANLRTLPQAISDGSADVLAIKVGDTGVPFCTDDGAGNWQDSYCTITSSTQITITQVLGGSNGTNAATMSTSTPRVTNAVPADMLRRIAVDSFPTSFSTTVPLTQIGTAHMPRQTVAGNLTFTAAANAVKGAFAEYPLILDGTSTLTFTGFTEHGSSSGLLNTAGMPNTVFFWYDGYTFWWSANQAANPVAIDSIAPTMPSAAVANATPSTVTLTASEALDSNFVPAASAFAISGHTVLAVTSVSGTNVTLSVSGAFVNGEAASTASYTQPGANGLRDTAGNLMASFSGLSITNNVQPVDSTAPAFSSAQVANAAPTQIVITLNETLANSVPPNSAFTPSGGKTVTGVSVSGTTATVTVNSAYVNGDVITISYAQPGTNPRLQDAAGNPTQSYTNYSVTNNVAAVGTETLSINTIATPQTVGTAFTVSGTWTNVQPANLDYRLSDDTAGVWTQVAATINANGTWSFSQNPSSASAGRTLSVRDRTNTSITATSNSYVVNAASSSYPRLDPATRSGTVSETGTGPYDYAGSAGQTITSETGGVTTLSLPAGVDGWIEVKVLNIGDVNSGVALYLRTLATPSNYNSGASAAFYTWGQNGTIPTAYRKAGGGNLVTAQANDVIRYARETVSGTVYAKAYVRQGGGSTLTPIFSDTNVTTLKAYFDVCPFGAASVELVAISGAT